MIDYHQLTKTEEELKQELVMVESKQQIEVLDRQKWKSTTETRELDLWLRNELYQIDELLDNHESHSEIILRGILSKRKLLRHVIFMINK